MNEAIGAVIPLGVGAALSPLPLIAVILMVASQHPARNGLAFLAASIVGTVAGTGIMMALALLIPADPGSGSHPVAGAIKIFLGVVLLGFGFRAWRRRPKPGEDAVLPAWMNKIDGMTAVQSLGFGLLLVLANTKNLPIMAAVGTHLASEPVVVMIVSGSVFVVLASAAMIAIVGGSLLFPQASKAPIGRLRETLVAHNSVILAAVFVLCGAMIIGHGISAF